jgi:hypothetical protein
MFWNRLFCSQRPIQTIALMDGSSQSAVGKSDSVSASNVSGLRSRTVALGEQTRSDRNEAYAVLLLEPTIGSDHYRVPELRPSQAPQMPLHRSRALPENIHLDN